MKDKLNISTLDLELWEDFVNNKHQLPIKVIPKEPNCFFSNMDMLSLNLDGISFAQTLGSAQYISSVPQKQKDTFLIGYTESPFLLKTKKGDCFFHNTSLIIDLSEEYSGEFKNSNKSKSLIVPFDLFKGDIVDKLRKDNSLDNTPLKATIDMIYQSVNFHDDNIDIKLNSIVNLISIDNLYKDRDVLVDIKIYIKSSLIKKEKISLDMVANKFFMSRRKLQYLFQSNGTSFLKFSNDIKKEIFSINK